MIEIQNSIQKNIIPISCLEHLDLEFNDCLGFRILNLGFNQEIARFIGRGNPRLRLLRRYSPRNDLEKEQQAKFLIIHLHLLFNPSASIFF
jgi:hypothetical protein